MDRVTCRESCKRHGSEWKGSAWQAGLLRHGKRHMYVKVYQNPEFSFCAASHFSNCPSLLLFLFFLFFLFFFFFLLFVVCCLLSVVCCLLFVACCLMLWLLLLLLLFACCLLFVVVCCLLFVVCCLLFVVCCCCCCCNASYFRILWASKDLHIGGVFVSEAENHGIYSVFCFWKQNSRYLRYFLARA